MQLYFQCQVAYNAKSLREGKPMPTESKRPLKVFLCHASGDKPQVSLLYRRLIAEGVDAWLDQEKLLPGQDWRVEIPHAVREADVVVVFLSVRSVTKEGYIQKEIKFALDSAQEKPEGAIFLIPARLEECTVPDQLSRWQWVDMYEENGFVKLMRSLKLRADKVGAVVEQSLYVEEDKEVEHRLDQFYTEGLAAFYTEDWDRACQRFQAILSERPNHKRAIEKLEEAGRQRSLSNLYAQSLTAYKLENWQIAVKFFEELSQKSADYKDSAQLLRNAKKQNQLNEFYLEAKALHSAQKWQAVLKVFEQISIIEPNFSDLDGLLPSAQQEVAEIKRLADLNDLYGTAVREMEIGQWYEARKLLEQVHKAQTGFLETEHLLRKVEYEIIKIEELSKRNNQVNVLYEQAHGLFRAGNWRKALDKVEEIIRLDDQFIDRDGISEKAKAELLCEEQETQKQNDLAAKYADAIRLLKENKYEESLNRWQEVKAIDPRYPDRQWVQRTAQKKLSEAAKVRQNKSRTSLKIFWMGFTGFVVVSFVVITIVALINFWPLREDPSSTSTIAVTQAVTATQDSALVVAQPLTLTVPEFSAAKVLYQDDFNVNVPSSWDNYLVDFVVQDGFLTLNGKNSWEGVLNRSNQIKENEGALFEFKYVSGTQFQMELHTGDFQNSSWRTWGVFGREKIFDINIGQGTQDISGNVWTGNLNSSANVSYIALLYVGENGNFITRIWERDDPSQYIELQKSMGSDWTNKSWAFALDIYSGTLIIDTYQEITLK